MPKTLEGRLEGKGLRVRIVVSRFNDFISARLLDGALDALQRTGVSEGGITVVKVPGAFEIPAAAKASVSSGAVDAVICLGAVIRGQTPHFDYIAAEVAKGVAHVALESKIPVVFGVLTTDTIEQAIERAGSKAGNKGWDAAMAAVELVNLYRELEK